MKRKTIKVSHYMSRDRVGRYDSFMARVRRGWHYTVLGAKAITLAAVMVAIGVFFGATNSVDAQFVHTDAFPQKLEALKADVVDRLQGSCESLGTDSARTPVIFDTNGVGSYGLWRWQIKSVVYYYKKLYGKEITNSDAIVIVLDDEKARVLTTDVIFKAGGIDNWRNCARKLNLVPEVNAIIQLSK